jgi:hypothetical protein
LKIEIFDLEFNSKFYYIQRESIVDKIKFNNRTIYSKFEKIDEPPSNLLIKQHLNRELTIALPLIRDNRAEYIVLEYKKEDNKQFYFLLKYILKLLYIEKFYTYESAKNGDIQIFIPVKGMSLEGVYEEIKKIERVLEVKSSKRCKITPDINLPLEYNQVTLPIGLIS